MMDKYAWAAAAYYSAKRTISRKFRNKPFRAEQILVEVVKDIGDTYDLRSFGGVIQSLRNDGLIEHAGHSPAKTSNGSPKNQWKKSGKWGK